MPDKTDENGVPLKDGLYSWITDEQYHADRGSLSVSGAKLLLPPSCPARFKERMDNPPKPKRIFDFGHLAHREVLGKGVEIVEIEADNYRTKDAREARDKAHANGKVPVLVGAGANDDFAAELGKAKLMAKRVFEHPIAGPLFERGHAETSLYHVDPGTGVRLRCRPDWLTLRGDERLWIVDYKTSATANPDELVRKFWQLGYFMQAAWYIDVVVALEIAVQPAFVFVVQEKDPPHIVTVVEYDAEAIAEGRRRNRQAIRLYVQCRERHEWPAYTDTITPISLPPWAFTETTLDDLITIED